MSLQHQKQTGNSKLGLSSCRESHRQKGGISQGVSCGRRFENLRRSVSHTRLSACLLDDQGSLEVTLLNQLVVTTNVTTGTGRKEGRKKGRRAGRKNEEGVCQPGFEPVMYDFTRMWITTEPIGTDERRSWRNDGGFWV